MANNIYVGTIFGSTSNPEFCWIFTGEKGAGGDAYKIVASSSEKILYSLGGGCHWDNDSKEQRTHLFRADLKTMNKMRTVDPDYKRPWDHQINEERDKAALLGEVE